MLSCAVWAECSWNRTKKCINPYSWLIQSPSAAKILLWPRCRLSEFPFPWCRAAASGSHRTWSSPSSPASPSRPPRWPSAPRGPGFDYRPRVWQRRSFARFRPGRSGFEAFAHVRVPVGRGVERCLPSRFSQLEKVLQFSASGVRIPLQLKLISNKSINKDRGLGGRSSRVV